MKTRKHVDEKCKELVEEKSLYVINMGTGDEIVESDQNQRSKLSMIMDSPTDDPKSEKSQDEAEVDHEKKSQNESECIEAEADGEIKSQNEAECIETEADDEEKILDGAECIETEAGDESSQEDKEDEDENMSVSEDKNTTSQGKSKSTKMRIKRGKIVDVGSQGNSPRKLKFKRGEVVTGADTTSKSGGRIHLKTKGTNFSNDKEQQHEPTVVLKHQDTQKKIDLEVLSLNNVIEETANKLVETHKSKVKALVGALESVISLQDMTSSATT